MPVTILAQRTRHDGWQGRHLWPSIIGSLVGSIAGDLFARRPGGLGRRGGAVGGVVGGLVDYMTASDVVNEQESIQGMQVMTSAYGQTIPAGVSPLAVGRQHYLDGD